MGWDSGFGHIISAQSLLLPRFSCSWTITGGALGAIQDVRDQLGAGHIQVKCLTHCSISLVLDFFYCINEKTYSTLLRGLWGASSPLVVDLGPFPAELRALALSFHSNHI